VDEEKKTAVSSNMFWNQSWITIPNVITNFMMPSFFE
jgi:hypothetical protein